MEAHRSSAGVTHSAATGSPVLTHRASCSLTGKKRLPNIQSSGAFRGVQTKKEVADAGRPGRCGRHSGNRSCQSCQRASRPLLTARYLAMVDSRQGLNRGRERRAILLESVT